jgi:type IV secretory pathway VirB4 component
MGSEKGRMFSHLQWKDRLRIEKMLKEKKSKTEIARTLRVDYTTIMREIKRGLNDHTDFKSMRPEDFPVLSDLYAVMEDAYQHYERENDPLYPKELLQEVLLGLHSMCKGAECKFFNGHTNVTSHRFLVFGVKDLINGSLGVRNAMLFNLLSCLSDKLLTEGHTVAGLDELYIWLSNPTAVEYIRNTLKRVRKKESALLMASQNLEDFIYRAGLLQFAKTDCMGWVSVIESK